MVGKQSVCRRGGMPGVPTYNIPHSTHKEDWASDRFPGKEKGGLLSSHNGTILSVVYILLYISHIKYIIIIITITTIIIIWRDITLMKSFSTQESSAHKGTSNYVCRHNWELMRYYDTEQWLGCF